ncbi:MAG: acyl-CoA dehydrogenase, partial [Rhizomicrobium sp.]
MSITADDIAAWRAWIGKTETKSELLAAEPLRRFAAAVQADLDVERRFPPLGHWAYFLKVGPTSALSADGHWRSGGLMPPVLLQRRMFAGATIAFAAPLRLDREAAMTSTVRDLTHKIGRSGELVLVEVEHRITQDGAECVRERQTFAFRPEGPPTLPVIPRAIDPQPGDVILQPNSVDLFRFSAVTFNSHRIHYDLPYVTGVEGYPGLIVQGPLTAAKLYQRTVIDGAPVTSFSFRATAPLFADQPVILRKAGHNEYRAIRCDGEIAMTTTVER